MRGVLLRSGKSEQFTALGETGQPVYRAALQLREAIRRKNPDHPELIEHLAIPQTDELGSKIDWYSDRLGDVIPWSSATEEERAPARAQLELLQSKIIDLSNDLLGLDANGQPKPGTKPGAQGDRTVFGKLLTCVVPFPDENFVYLVDGKPVLTFWGFIHAGAERSREPLHCLYPKTAKVVEPVSPPPVPPVVPPVVPPLQPEVAPVINAVAKRPWWRYLLWLLALLLLLALLFGLRGCWPGLGFGGLPLAELPKHEVNIPSGKTIEPSVNGQQVPGAVIGTNTDTGLIQGQGDAGRIEPAPEPGVLQAPESNNSETGDPQADASKTEAPQPPDDKAPTPPQIAEDQQPQTPPELPDEPQPQSAQLTIPPNAGNGAADFLNGNYNGAGIQEVGTGKPLSLKYDFQNGKGQATVKRPDGVRCNAPVVAAMNGGNLSITSEAQAACADGSSYDLPQVNCKPGANSIAGCTGNYGASEFDMLMEQAGQ
ncbi:SrfA family protein [Pseudomonas sp. DG56-2]|uniref:SrfA family protein n=1 Tax=Pseudomonas sp. DG56-2 TaxID=2320270 RepID=UPI0010A649EF|nr:SrfA family protein [Pseudomonas sp. DG56-2]